VGPLSVSLLYVSLSRRHTVSLSIHPYHPYFPYNPTTPFSTADPGCLQAFSRHGCDVAGGGVELAHVPGSFELPLVARAMAKSGKFDAVVAVGAVVRGATTHYDEVCGAATSGLLSAGNDTGVPVIFGVITTETMEQAQDRAGGKAGNKGYEAGVTAIEMGNVLRQLRAGGRGAKAWGVDG